MRTEKTLWVIFIISFILKLLNVPGHGLLTLVSGCLLGIIYHPGGFYFFCDKQLKSQNIALSIVSGVFLSIIPIAIIFKLQNYNGQNIMLIYGLVSGITFFIITYFLRKKGREDLQTYYKNMYLRTTVLAIAIIFFTFLPRKIITQIQYRNNPERVKLLNNIYDNPNNEQYREDLQKYIHSKDSLEYSKKIK